MTAFEGWFFTFKSLMETVLELESKVKCIFYSFTVNCLFLQKFAFLYKNTALVCAKTPSVPPQAIKAYSISTTHQALHCRTQVQLTA
jgi:hypothetical protein